MMVAHGVLTSRGGKTSHAAVVARGMGRTCVCGAESLDVDTREGEFTVRGGRTIARGRRDLDRRLAPARSSTARCRSSTPHVVRHFEGEAVDDPLVEAVARLMEHADASRRLAVRTNADTAEDAARARRFGAQGIGLCRTEHMFLGERRAARREPDRGRRRGRAGGRARRAAPAAARGLPARSSRRWTACRSRSG